MLSMTGYGKGEYKVGGIELTCEIKTVNNRYLDVNVKAPRIFTAFEDVIRKMVREKLTRGHADLFISLKDKREKSASFTLLHRFKEKWRISLSVWASQLQRDLR